MVAALVLGMTTTQVSKMQALLESCPDHASGLRLVIAALEAQFADDFAVPGELSAVLNLLHDAVEAAEFLDEATR